MRQVAGTLVGRTAEVGSLDGALAELQRKRFRALEVVGEPGIGKTRLLAELHDRAERRRHLVLSGSASELEGDIPFWVLVDALDEHVAEVEPHRLDALGDEARDELARVLPSLRASGANASAPGEQYRTHRAVRALLEVLATRAP